MNAAVHVRTPCRLHFGMFSFGHANSAQFGGVGAMIEPPNVEVTISPVNISVFTDRSPIGRDNSLSFFSPGGIWLRCRRVRFSFIRREVTPVWVSERNWVWRLRRGYGGF